MSRKELKQNQKLILEKLETLVSGRDKVATKEDIEKLEAKLESKIDGISSQVKELNDKTFFRTRLIRQQSDSFRA